MHSFHQPRGRVLFEVFCALAISASCVGAWMQTGAWALLPAAAVAALYGFVHLFDMDRHKPAIADDVANDAPVAEVPSEVPALRDTVQPQPIVHIEPEAAQPVEEADLVELAAPRASGSRRTKAPRKSGGRRASVTKEAKVTEFAPREGARAPKLAPPEEAEISVAVALEDAEVSAAAPPDEAEVSEIMPAEEAVHTQLAPLFEPEPFFRQQRTVFGRKAG